MCEHSNQIHAYHDGELNAGERAALEAHLASCESCKHELKQLAAISRSLVAAPLPTFSGDLSARILEACKRARRAQEGGTRKLAGWLTAAASILLVVSMMRVSVLSDRTGENSAFTETPTSVASRDWELAAMMPPAQAEEAGSGSTDLIQLAQWMARDLSPDERR